MSSDPNSHQTAESRIDALARPDKWYLAAGDGGLFAPSFPTALDTPGFWDGGMWYDLTIAPLFAVAAVDQSGRPLPLIVISRRWRPDCLTTRYHNGNGGVIVEKREVLPGGRFRCSFTFDAPDADVKHLVAYLLQPSTELSSHVVPEQDNQSIKWQRTVNDRANMSVPVNLQLTAEARNAKVDARVSFIEGGQDQPRYDMLPFADASLWNADVSTNGETQPSMANINLAMALRVEVVDSTQSPTEDNCPIIFELTVATPEFEHARRSKSATWLEHFDAYPQFSCDDAMLARYFDYRVYGLKLCEVAGGMGAVTHPAVAEGIGYFHVPITYSGQCHMLECRWSEDPAIARGSLLNFIENQKPDGSFHGRLYFANLDRTNFYHSNWGDAVLELDALHPDDDFLTTAYAGLGKYAHWLLEDRDNERSGMIDVLNQFETGQEYMSRYMVVNPTADRDGWENRTRLKAIDVTVYTYQLCKALADIAERLKDDKAAAQWKSKAEMIGQAIVNNMWSNDINLFSDVDPTDGRTTNIKAAVCFYPMLTDLIDEQHLAKLLDHLENKEEFATPWPVPSSSADDPMFNAEGLWKGVRRLCPWNGRTWPMTNSHIIEGLIRQWRRRDATGEQCVHHRAGQLAGQLLQRFVHLMFRDGDVNRPNCFEHYNPITGEPSAYRGIDDYQHSWVIDLLMKGVAGIHIEAQSANKAALVIDPLPMNVEASDVRRVHVRGHIVEVRRAGKEFHVTIDGRTFHGNIGTPLALPLPLPDVILPREREDRISELTDRARKPADRKLTQS